MIQKILMRLRGIFKWKIHEVIDLIGYLKMKSERDIFREIERASESSMDFWDNENNS